MKNKVTIKGKEIDFVGYGEGRAKPIETILNELLLALDESKPEWDARELKSGDTYYYIYSELGLISKDKWYGSVEDIYHLRTNNVYPTEEAAQKAYEEIMDREV